MTETAGLVDHLFRERAGQMVAWLTRVFGPSHLDLVEEVVQDALVKALQQWPYSGVPANPAGWLFQVARNGALDALRRNTSFRSRSSEIAAELNRTAAPHAPASDYPVQDDELRMIFLCCHPALPKDARVALSLKTVGGFGVQEIAGAFLTSEPTIAQRLVRAKRRLRELELPFDLPSGVDLSARLDSVLEVIYLMFNEGYAAKDGESLVREDVCGEALRLGRLVARSPLTSTPAAHALVSLMAFQAARLPSRVDENGEVLLLDEQDRTRWDPRLIALGFTHLERSAEGSEITPYHVQAAIAAAHAVAPSAQETPWTTILRLYDDLVALNPSPLVRLNRAVAVWKVNGVEAALKEVENLEDESSLERYYLLPGVKGRLLAERGDRDGARRAFEHALTLPCSEPERRLVRRQIDALCNDPKKNKMKIALVVLALASALPAASLAQERSATSATPAARLCRADSSPAGSPAAATNAKIAQLQWLEGTWIGTSGSSTFEERWTPPAGGSMLAVARTLRNGAMNGFEFLCIVERNGSLVYQAMPNGRQPATDFTLTQIDANSVTFENPAHDFPKKIRYSLKEDRTLEAVVSGTDGQKPLTFSFKRQ